MEETNEWCAKHGCRKLQVQYGRGKWGWEYPRCNDEDRERIRQMFQEHGVAKQTVVAAVNDWADKEAKKVVLWWGNFFNWGRTPNRYGDHIPVREQRRLERMIATRLHRAFQKGKRDRVNDY